MDIVIALKLPMSITKPCRLPHESSPLRCRNRLPVGGYIAEQSLATTVFLTLRMQHPLFPEDEAGIGRTELAHVPGWRIRWTCPPHGGDGGLAARW